MTNNTGYTVWTKPMETWRETPMDLVVNLEAEEEIKNSLSTVEESINKCIEPLNSIVSEETMRHIVS